MRLSRSLGFSYPLTLILCLSVWPRTTGAGPLAVRLTDDSQYEVDPEWSPDGKWIAFFDNGIWVLSLEDGGKRQIVEGWRPNRPSWSPDGQVGYLLNGDIWSVPRTGGMSSQVSEGHKYVDFAWSPDGDRIAVVEVHDASQALPWTSLGMLTPADGQLTTLTDESLGGEPSSISWSPDGARLVFDNGGLWTIPAEGGTPIKIVSSGCCPAWSPTSNTIAFAALPDGGISVVSPDGSRLVVFSGRGGGTWDLWILDLTTPVEPLTWGKLKQLYTPSHP